MSPFELHPEGARVLVIGALNVDMTLSVAHLPLPGETLLSSAMAVSCGGKGRNQAAAVAAMGAAAGLAGAVGDDANGSRLLADLDARRVDRNLVRVLDGAQTGLGLIVVDRAGENSIVVHPGANAEVTAVDAATLETTGARVLLASLEVPMRTVAATIEAARGRGLISVVNLSPVPDGEGAEFRTILTNADVVIVNRGEAQALVGEDPVDDDALMRALRAWRKDRRPAVVVTLGAGGATVVGPEGVRAFAAPRVLALSTVGAGDVFAATLSVALAGQRTLDEGVQLACVAGAIAVSDPESLSASRVMELADATYPATTNDGGRR